MPLSSPPSSSPPHRPQKKEQLLDPIDPSFLTDSFFQRPQTAGSERIGSPSPSDQPGARPGGRAREYKSNHLKAAEARGGPSRFRRELQANRLKAQADNSLQLLSSIDFFAPEAGRLHEAGRSEGDPVRLMDEMARASVQAEAEAKRELALKQRRMAAAAERAERARVEKDKERERERERERELVAADREREKTEAKVQGPLAPEWTQEEEARRLEKVKALRAEEERKRGALGASAKGAKRTPSTAVAAPAIAPTPAPAPVITIPIPAPASASTSAPNSAHAPDPAPAPSSSSAEQEYGDETFDAPPAAPPAEEEEEDIAEEDAQASLGSTAGASVVTEEPGPGLWLGLEGSSEASAASVAEAEVEAEAVAVADEVATPASPPRPKKRVLIVDTDDSAEATATHTSTSLGKSSSSPEIDVIKIQDPEVTFVRPSATASPDDEAQAGVAAVTAAAEAVLDEGKAETAEAEEDEPRELPVTGASDQRTHIISQVTRQMAGEVSSGAQRSALRTLTPTPPGTPTPTPTFRDGDAFLPSFEPPTPAPAMPASVLRPAPSRAEAVAAKAAEVSAHAQQQGVRSEYFRNSPPRGGDAPAAVAAFGSQSAPTTPAKPWSANPVQPSFADDLLQELAFAEGEEEEEEIGEGLGEGAASAVLLEDVQALPATLPPVDPGDMFVLQGRALAAASSGGNLEAPEGEGETDASLDASAMLKRDSAALIATSLEPTGFDPIAAEADNDAKAYAEGDAAPSQSSSAAPSSQHGRRARSGGNSRGLGLDDAAEDAAVIRERLGYDEDEFDPEDEEAEEHKQSNRRSFDIQPFYDDEFDIEGGFV